MKVIDLLVKIANNEEVPKKIKYNKKIYEYSQKDNRYHNVQGGLDLSSIFGDYNFNYLNDEIEIIEEKPKKIEELKIKNIYKCDDYQQIYINFKETWNKINEILDYLLEKESDK